MLGKCSMLAFSILVAVAALVVNQSLTPPVHWHEGAAWEEFLSLYDGLVSQHFADCMPKSVETTFGVTQVYACGDPSGAPVMVQGGAGSSCVIYTDWILPKLVAEGKYVLAVDFVCDVGRSRPKDGDKANCPKTWDDLVSWVQQLLAALSISRPASLVGYSYGAFISATTAIKAPDVVDKLVLMAPAAIVAEISASFIMRVILHTLIYAGPDGFALEDWMHADPDFSFAQNMSADAIKFQLAIKKASPHATTLVPNRMFTEEELTDLSKHPTLLIFGENETVVDVDVAIETTKRFPDITSVVLPNSGHLMIIEQHRQMIEDRIVSFLTT